MSVIFDENGLATQAGEIRVYYYEPSTGEYRGWSDEYINVGVSMPGHSTTIDLGEESPGFVSVFNGTGWEKRSDNRGVTVYSTADRATTVVNYIGEIRSGFTTVAPSTQYDKWDGSKWVKDAVAEHAVNVADAEQKKSILRSAADAEITWLKDAVDEGIATDAEIAALSLWKTYRVQLMRIDMSNAPDIEWPELPVNL